MKAERWFIWGLMGLLIVSVVGTATLKGTIYDLELEKVEDALVSINTEPNQQYLAKEGEYSFEVPAGEYELKAKKGELEAEEKIRVKGEGEFVFDLFLLPGFEEEDALLGDIEELGVSERETMQESFFGKYPLGSYLAAFGILLIAIGRIVLARKKYGPLRRKRKKEEKEKEPEKKEENLQRQEETGDLTETLEIIKNHEGRITQKELRKEMMHLSEAKISLILTELKHKEKIEKIKKGRGNVVILKNS